MDTDTCLLIWNVIKLFIFTSYDELYYKWFGNRRPLTSEQEEKIEGEVVVITGANRGIGKQIALEMAKRKATVVFGCRNMKLGEKAVNDIWKQTGNRNLHLIHLDLMDMDSVEEFSKTVSKNYPTIKLLVNNAGVPFPSNKLTKDGFNSTVAANHLGHFLLTNMLLQNLRQGGMTGPSRVIAVSSLLQALSTLDTRDLMMTKSGLGYRRGRPYHNTKHANSLMAKELAKRMKDEGSKVHAYSVCPGFVSTDIYDHVTGFPRFCFNLFNFFAGLSVSQAVVEYMLPICLSKDIGENESGFMFRYRKPWNLINRKLSKEKKLSEDLWNLSAKLVKLDERLRFSVYQKKEE